MYDCGKSFTIIGSSKYQFWVDLSEKRRYDNYTNFPHDVSNRLDFMCREML